MITEKDINQLRVNLSVQSKNGLDFIFAASLIWLGIAFIWTLDFNTYDKSVFTFFAGGFMLPLALTLSKVLKTKWSNKENPLQPLGMLLNLAQLFYFPFLIFTLIKMPDYFAMVYAIVTGAHFFPYAWFYKVKAYAFFAGIISLGALILGLTLQVEQMYFLPLGMSVCLLVLAGFLYVDYKRKLN
jgi:hypothetical protein